MILVGVLTTLNALLLGFLLSLAALAGFFGARKQPKQKVAATALLMTSTVGTLFVILGLTIDQSLSSTVDSDTVEISATESAQLDDAENLTVTGRV